MGVDYREQYEPDQLEPFWPNEIGKMLVVVLCTLAVIMVLAVLPVLLEMIGIGGVLHQEEPANPKGATPVGIKPEWYFLAVYQYLKLMPTTVLGISGKTLGVMSQLPIVLALVFVPFWYRRKANVRPGRLYVSVITLSLFGFLAMTIWGAWPERHVDGHEQLVSFGEYFGHHPLMFILMGAALITFFALSIHEMGVIRRVLGGSSGPPRAASADERGRR